MIKYPKHLAVIMDGNGRWAEKRGRSRFWGHIKGTEVAQSIIEYCAKETKVEFLTLYAFSTENWSRPEEEVSFLFKLLERHLLKKRKKLIESNVQLKTIGDLEPLPNGLKEQIDSLSKETKENTGLNLTLALNYGGRQEIINSMNSLIKEAKDLSNETQFSEIDISRKILSMGGGLPDPDLIIRTSGEKRISNFLLWQSAYSEFYFSDTLWPDFKTDDLEKAFLNFSNRERRFGGLTLEDKNFIESNKEFHV